MNLRPYQSAAVEAVCERLYGPEPCASTLLVLPTGTGKTICFAHVIKRVPRGRVMVIAHREELIRQAADKIFAVTGEEPDIEMAAERADLHMFKRSRAVVASKDTLRGNRLARFKPSDFGLVITDEAHHAVASSYTDIYKHFAGVPHLGVTATPDRHDEEALGQVFESVAYVYEIQDAIRDGWLVPIKQRSVEVQGLDYSAVRTTAGDLNGKDLADVMANESVLQQIAHATIREAKWRKALVFAPPGYKQEGQDACRVSERLVEVFNRRREGCARLVSGETHKDERRQTLVDFAEGKFQFMVNVGVFTEGFDDPSIGLVVMARATESRSLYAQMVGRGTRPLPGVVDPHESDADRRAAIARSAKPACEVLDFEGNAGRHKLMTTADILGGNYTDEEIALAGKQVQEANKAGQSADMSEALERAHQEILAAKERDRLRRKFVVGNAEYQTKLIDPFDVLEIEPPTMRGWDHAKPVSDKQREILEKNGVVVSGEMKSKQASALIEEIFRRRKTGAPTFKQSRALARRGLTAKTFDEARAMLDEVASKEGWKKQETTTQ